jgi:hypothetical protein
MNLSFFNYFFTFPFFLPQNQTPLTHIKIWNPHYILDLKKELNQEPLNQHYYNLFICIPLYFLRNQKITNSTTF